MAPVHEAQYTMSDKAVVQEKAKQLIALTTGFSDEYLDADYKHLCEKLILKMSRKRNVPFETGRLEIWAAAVIWALGGINFLFDKSFEPYATGDDICDYFGTSKSTVGQKAKVIRDMFKLGYYDREFSTQRILESNPFNNLMMVNGYIVDKRFLD